MTRRGFYILSLWLPLLFPILCIITVALGIKPTGNYEPVIAILAVSLFYGGTQYFIFLLGLLYWFRGKDAQFIRRKSKLLPIFFLPVAVVGFLILFFGLDFITHLFTGDEPLSQKTKELPAMLGFIGSLSVLLGYGYVLLVQALGFMLSKIGFIRD